MLGAYIFFLERDLRAMQRSILCRSRRELSGAYLLFTCKKLLRYSRERARHKFAKICPFYCISSSVITQSAGCRPRRGRRGRRPARSGPSPAGRTLRPSPAPRGAPPAVQITASVRFAVYLKIYEPRGEGYVFILNGILQILKSLGHLTKYWKNYLMITGNLTIMRWILTDMVLKLCSKSHNLGWYTHNIT